MALKVIDSKCRVEDGKLVIVIEGTSPEEVLSAPAKTLALQKAASCGYPRLGINGHSGSYPVDENGVTYEDWNEQARKQAIKAYRNDIKLMSGL